MAVDGIVVVTANLQLELRLGAGPTPPSDDERLTVDSTYSNRLDDTGGSRHERHTAESGAVPPSTHLRGRASFCIALSWPMRVCLWRLAFGQAEEGTNALRSVWKRESGR